MANGGGFNASWYLKEHYGPKDGSDCRHWVRHRLECFHKAFQTLQDGIRVLDYGSGPVILSGISAAKAKEIVLADYDDNCRQKLYEWKNRGPNAFVWSPYFKYVVQELESKGEREVEEREEKVRELVKVVPCDIHCDQSLVEDDKSQPYYDVVMSSLLLDDQRVSRNEDEYRSNVKKLGSLVKPGGMLFYYGTSNDKGYYTDGDQNFPTITVDDQFTKEAFEEAGFCDCEVTVKPKKAQQLKEAQQQQGQSLWFVSGKRPDT